MQIVYEIKVVGGGYDGAPGLRWLDDGKHPPPAQILVGVCKKGEHCGASVCNTKVTHISFWTTDEDDVPLATQRYEKQEEHVLRDDETLDGQAVYAIGGLLDPRNFGAAAKVPA